jgi:hypothetical protein
VQKLGKRGIFHVKIVLSSSGMAPSGNLFV